MKKILSFSIAALGLFTMACEKDNSGVRAKIEDTLPAIEITSMGLMNQVGPFATNDSLLQVTFTGAMTNNAPGTFDFAWYDSPADVSKAKRYDSVRFKSWMEPVSKATDSNAISVVWGPTSYANTQTFTGSLILKIKKLPAETYTLRLYARTEAGVTASLITSKFIIKK